MKYISLQTLAAERFGDRSKARWLHIRVCAPNGGTCEMWGDSDDAHQRFAYFVLRQMIRDIAAVTEDRDAYRVSSEIRGANIEAMHEVLIELSALLAGQDCSP